MSVKKSWGKVILIFIIFFMMDKILPTFYNPLIPGTQIIIIV